MKICSKCKEEKELTEFNKCKIAKDGFYSYCKECYNLYMKKYRNSSRGKAQMRSYRLKYDYGITPQGYNLMFLAQRGECRICGIHQSELKMKLHIDYDAETETIRGILCGNCLRGLASLGEHLLEAIIYLEG